VLRVALVLVNTIANFKKHVQLQIVFMPISDQQAYWCLQNNLPKKLRLRVLGLISLPEIVPVEDVKHGYRSWRKSHADADADEMIPLQAYIG
jgi:hypothetical protein